MELTYLTWYSAGFAIFLLINAFLAGYNNIEFSKHDLIEALIWPITTIMVFGTIAKAITTKIKRKG